MTFLTDLRSIKVEQQTAFVQKARSKQIDSLQAEKDATAKQFKETSAVIEAVLQDVIDGYLEGKGIILEENQCKLRLPDEYRTINYAQRATFSVASIDDAPAWWGDQKFELRVELLVYGWQMLLWIFPQSGNAVPLPGYPTDVKSWMEMTLTRMIQNKEPLRAAPLPVD